VLDLGCGQRFPFALRCAAAGASVTALDLEYVKPDFLRIAFYQIARHNGVKKAVKSMVRRLSFDRRYYEVLEGASGEALRSFVSKSSLSFLIPKRQPIPCLQLLST
jgi:hypothetical protein